MFSSIHGLYEIYTSPSLGLYKSAVKVVMGWNIVMSIISVWKNGLYALSLKRIWLFFIFIFHQQAKVERKRENIRCWLHFSFTAMISKRKGKALISSMVHDSRRKGRGLAPLERAEVLMYS